MQGFLKALAVCPTTEPTGHQFTRTANMPVSSINQTLKALLMKDMVYQITQEDGGIEQLKLPQYRVLDPLLAYALRKYA